MAKATRRFTYQPRDPSVVKTRSNQRGGDFDSIFKEGIKVYKPREGKNRIRILQPFWSKANHYGFDVYVNYGIGIEEQAYLSLSEMKKEPDPLAEARKQAEREGNKKLADSLRPSRRVGFYLIDRMAEDEGVQLWLAPWTVDKAFCGIAIDIETGVPTMVDHPEEGCDIIFFKEGTGMTTKYPAEKMRVLKPSLISEDESQADEWLAFAEDHPIPDMLNYYDYTHIASVFEGHVVKDDDGDAKPVGRRKPAANPLPDEDEAPVRQVRKVAPKVESDEQVDEETGEVTKKTNGKPVQKAEDEDNEAEEARMSVSSIRDRLAGRRQRPSANED